MPYVHPEARAYLINDIEKITTKLEGQEWNPGFVNYVISKILWAWFRNNRSYKTICLIRGTLSGVLSEFDRRMAFAYEDEKIKENGDIQ